MGWKYGIHETENSQACFNVCVFATRDEAERAGAELLSRWLAPHHYSVVEVDEEVNYVFAVGMSRPMSVEQFAANVAKYAAEHLPEVGSEVSVRAIEEVE